MLKKPTIYLQDSFNSFAGHSALQILTFNPIAIGPPISTVHSQNSTVNFFFH